MDAETFLLGTRECQAFVEPCVFGEGESYYDTMPGEVSYGFMYHGITYAEEAILEEDQDQMTVRFWRPVMKKMEELLSLQDRKIVQRKGISVIWRKRSLEKKRTILIGLDEFIDEEVAD